METDLAAIGFDHEIAASFHSKFRISIFEFRTSSFDFERNGFRIGPGRDHEIVFQLPLVAVVNQVYARIHALILYLGVARNIGAPLFRIAADEVVRLAGQLVESRHARRAIRAHELHAEDVLCPLSVVLCFSQPRDE